MKIIPDFELGKVNQLVEAFIYEGEPIDDIYLKKQHHLILGIVIETGGARCVG